MLLDLLDLLLFPFLTFCFVYLVVAFLFSPLFFYIQKINRRALFFFFFCFDYSILIHPLAVGYQECI